MTSRLICIWITRGCVESYCYKKSKIKRKVEVSPHNHRISLFQTIQKFENSNFRWRNSMWLEKKIVVQTVFWENITSILGLVVIIFCFDFNFSMILESSSKQKSIFWNLLRFYINSLLFHFTLLWKLIFSCSWNLLLPTIWKPMLNFFVNEQMIRYFTKEGEMIKRENENDQERENMRKW